MLQAEDGSLSNDERQTIECGFVTPNKYSSSKRDSDERPSDIIRNRGRFEFFSQAIDDDEVSEKGINVRPDHDGSESALVLAENLRKVSELRLFIVFIE